ncbi:glycosyltransferase [Rhodobacter sp. NSM]|uniref:glycosyltransferase n=1 Tax=Rhodobacter sp. NSM TaxID=3457501 RepID=UPI003FD2B39D
MQRLLDLTRLASRAGRGPLTGVDRVEAAYLSELLRQDDPVHGLLRVPLGYLLLGRAGMAALHEKFRIGSFGQPDLIGRLLRRGQPERAGIEAEARRNAIGRSAPWRLTALLRRHLPQGASYLNTGHSNLSDLTLRQIRASGLKMAVLIHDVIPLEHPHLTRPGTPKAFARKLAAVSAHADVLIHASEDVRASTEPFLCRASNRGSHGRALETIVAPLGVPLAKPEAVRVPADLPPSRPYFIALGTIEPRKNLGLLLDVWEDLHGMMPEAAVPALLLLGARGWESPAFFHRLDDSPHFGRTIFQRSGLPDEAVASLLQGAEALLFPSLAEGFGIPPVEAAALGVPVISSPLPSVRKTLNDYPVYLDATDRYLWARTIATWGHRSRHPRAPGRPAPTWQDHFDLVFGRV